jgi:hypothetical protein
VTGAEFGEVDYDLLADYIGGALEGTADESVVAALVADDPAWREAFEDLRAGMAAVGAELGRLAPEPMPAELAARLETLFAEQAPGASGAVEKAPSPLTLVHDSGAPVSAQGVRTRGRRLRWATPIAVAAGAVAFVGFGLDYLSGRQSESASDSSVNAGAGSAFDKQDAPLSSAGGLQILATGTDYTGVTLGSSPESAQALSASQPSAFLPSSPSAAAPYAAPPNSPSAERKDPAPERAAESDPLATLRPKAALQKCLDAIATENGFGAISPLSVDYARFNGTAAVVVRFTAGNGGWAWASGAACGASGGGAATLDKVPVR